MSILAESVDWTPSLIGAGIVSSIVLAVKLIPWAYQRKDNGNGNGNGKAAAAAEGEARGKLVAIVDTHDRAIEEQKHTAVEQWTAINEQRDRLTKIEVISKRTEEGVSSLACDVKEIQKDIKEVLKAQRRS